MIELSSIQKRYRIGESTVYALRDVSLSIRQGEFIAIMGASGSGKSTLMHILGLLDIPDNGNYVLSGCNVSSLRDDEHAALRNTVAGFVFQQFHLLKRMSLVDNVRLPHLYSGKEGDFKREALECLKLVGLEERAGHKPNQLSGGQQQRVAIARALINDPMTIFADEPTGNLDSMNSAEIMKILKSLHEQGKTIVMVTHEENIAAYADRVITMSDGMIIRDECRQQKAVKQLTTSGQVIAAAGPRLWRNGRLGGFLHQAMQSVLANKVRSFLSILGILVGVASVIAMMALGSGAQASMEEQLKSMGSNLLSVRGGSATIRGAAQGAGAVTRFTFRDVDDIASMTSLVKRASGYVSGAAQTVYGSSNWSTSLNGVGLEYADMRSATPEIGRWFTRQEVKNLEKVVVIGVTVAKELFGSNVNPVGKSIKINRINFKVIGVARAKGFSGPRDEDDIVLIPVTTAMHRVLGKDYLDAIYVEALLPSLIDEAKNAVDRVIRKRHRLSQEDDTFSIRDMTEIQEMLSSTTQTMTLLLGSIAAISLIVGGIGIMNIMLVSVTERTREIGLRKAIGAKKNDIMLQFIVESVGLTLVGGLFGVVSGMTVAWCLSIFAGWAVQTSVYSILLATGFSMVIGLGFGLWPAKKASDLEPVEALRYE